MKYAHIIAAAILAAAPALADTQISKQMTGTVSEENMANLIRTRDITGGTIYTMNAAYDETNWNETRSYAAVEDNWDSIGEIEDVVLSRDGQMTGIIAEVGGFLDIGDAHVLIRMDDVRLVAVDDQTYAYVTRKSEEEHEAGGRRLVGLIGAQLVSG